LTLPEALTAKFSELEPQGVWQHFATLCRIPRASKQEALLRQTLVDWADAGGLETQVDAAGNLIIRKPASRAGAHLPSVVLQAHLDMVCQANAAVDHDFSRDSIKPVLRDGWLVAENTTLGADNGIGVALILAALADETFTHGPLEALLTVDEEAGMGGARGLEAGLLHGKRMLNLDTEAWGEFYLGCAGGLDVNVERPGVAEALPAGLQVFQISLSGLRGGHSGVNIHEERGNAIKLLVGVLAGLEATLPFRLAGLHGGTARNALPREASAVLALAPADWGKLQSALADSQIRLQESLAGVESGIRLSLEPANATQVLSANEQAVWLHSLQAAPHGVWRMSQRVPGVVDTSNNLGMVDVQPAHGRCNFMVRSLRLPEAEALAAEIGSLWALTATAVDLSGHYPGWAPNPDSPLLAVCQSVFQREFQVESSVQVIHAGLECGLIGDKYPGMDIVSFGSTIRGAHAPGEAVEVESVGRVWHLLKAILAAVK
jgi:dipeptidase D